MPKFRFTLTRDLTQSVSVEVEGDDIEQAQQAALTNPPQSGWEIDDNPPQDAYLPDPDDFEEIT